MKVPRNIAAKILGMASPRLPKQAQSVATGGKYGLKLELTLPVRVVSEANVRDCWAVANKRKKEQEDAVYTAMSLFGLNGLNCTPAPTVVTFTRIGKKLLDTDNLARAFKGVRDCIARTVLNMDDGDERITWRYEQRTEGTPGVVVTIEVAT